MKKKIIPLFPIHKTYVEVFGGGASILFEKFPSKIEVYNDLNSGLFNFFMVISDEEKFIKFYNQVSLLPCSRELYYYCLNNWEKEKDEIKKVVYWFVIAGQSFGGFFGKSWGFGVTTNVTNTWLSLISKLPDIYKRLQKVQIENRDWEKIIDIYDTKDTLFYLDPPYVLSTRKDRSIYKHEMTNEEHKNLVNKLLNIKGQFVLSGYDNEIYNLLDNFEKHQFEVSCYIKKTKDKEKRLTKIENLWIKRHNNNSLF